MSKFQDLLEKDINFQEEEKKTLEYWEKIKAFETSLELSKDRPEFTFYDGPPFATGLPHYGHILAGTIKDTVTRYAHQTGHYVSRRFGWDCHGLPVEFEIDKTLGIKGRDDVMKMGVANYNKECRGIVSRYTKEWEKTVKRLGRWIDFENDYKTMDPAFMESVWWVFKTLFDKGLVYRGYKVMPFSTACGTPLSNFEAGQNYKDVVDPAIVVSFPLTTDPDCAFVAWTTTPWTLPSNLALCVNPEFDYVKIRDLERNKTLILLEKRLCQLFPKVNKPDTTQEQKDAMFTVLERMKGAALIGMTYVPLFDYFRGVPNNTFFRVVGDSYVTEEGGTGIVHQAPAFGEDDYRVCVKWKVIGKGEEIPCPVDMNGRYTSEVPEYQGIGVKEADNKICEDLKKRGRLVMKENYNHSYPFCWRSETPLIYKAVVSWFVNVEAVKERLIHNNTQTYWVPAFVQEKRFHNWLKDAKDWAISRNRFWGTPIPLWVSDDLEEIVAIGSVEELFQLSGVRATDLHKEHVDHITIPSKKGKGTLKRIDEVFDCWFESGSMPYAQLHYPFENADRFDKGFPADFIAEGLDQTRGWFYTLMVISTCLFDKPAFKNLIVNGIVLASNGQKMSKRLKNYPDPVEVVDKYGADSLRLYLINSPVVRAESLKFDEKGVLDNVKGVFLPWYNTFKFFAQCVDRIELVTKTNFNPDGRVASGSINLVDVWILAAVTGLVQFVHQEMRAYRLYTVVPKLLKFLEDLTNWYVRLNRDRLKGSSGDEEAVVSLNVLAEVLTTMTLIMAPISPYFSEYTYQHLRKLSPLFKNTDPAIPRDAFGKADSVHFLMLPQVVEERLDPRAVERFDTLQTAIAIVRKVRDVKKIVANLPLKQVLIVARDEKDLDALRYLDSYFRGEINCKEVVLSSEYDKLCTLKVKPNFQLLGERFKEMEKKRTQEVQKAITSLTNEQILQFIQVGVIDVSGFVLAKDELIITPEFKGDTKKFHAGVSDNGSLLIAVDTTVDEESRRELRAKEISATVQKMRKDAGLQMTDRVEIFYSDDGSGEIGQSLAEHASTLIKRIKVLPVPLTLMPQDAKVLLRQDFSPKKKDDKEKNENAHNPDISKNAYTIVLTAFRVNFDKPAILAVCGGSGNESVAACAEGFLLSADYDRLMSLPSISVKVDGVDCTFVKDVHYFATKYDQVKGK